MGTSKSHTATVNIIIEDKVRLVDYTLSVTATIHPGSADHYDAWTGWSQGDPAECEILDCLCESVVCWTGDNGAEAVPDEPKYTGEWVYERFQKEIDKRAFEAVAADAEAARWDAE